jgi:hypothetical protein
MRKMKITLVVLISAVICLGIFLVPNALASGDTGTYQIQEYNVVLTPHSNGEVEISYMQKWLITGGHIPWVTVGVTNSDFAVRNFGGAAKVVESTNQGGWYGVRIDLDRDYQPQETFQFNFTIIQRRLLERADNGYRLAYTPGWYDRAFTDALTVKLASPAKVADLKMDPQPNSVNGQELVWTRKNLGKGERFTVSIDFPTGIYNQTLMDKSVQGGGIPLPPPLPPPPDKSAQGGEIPDWIPAVFIIVLCIIGIVALASTNREDDDERHGSSYTSPAIYSGSSRGSSHSHSHSSGGGGGFGGRSISCVCACVSCACACACAGGGGAGCKKPHHSCPICSPKGIIKNDT